MVASAGIGFPIIFHVKLQSSYGVTQQFHDIILKNFLISFELARSQTLSSNLFFRLSVKMLFWDCVGYFEVLLSFLLWFHEIFENLLVSFEPGRSQTLGLITINYECSRHLQIMT